MSAPIAGPCRPSQLQSHQSEMATASKRKRSSYDAEFKLRIIESAENSNNYATGRQFRAYLRLIHGSTILDNIWTRFLGAIYTWERLIGEYMFIRYVIVVILLLL